MTTDITFCTRECKNTDCKRNIKHIKGFEGIFSMCDFKDCEDYKEVEE